MTRAVYEKAIYKREKQMDRAVYKNHKRNVIPTEEVVEEPQTPVEEPQTPAEPEQPVEPVVEPVVEPSEPSEPSEEPVVE